MIDIDLLHTNVATELEKLSAFMRSVPDHPSDVNVLRLYCGDYFTIPGTKNHIRFSVSFFPGSDEDRWVFDIDIEPLDKSHSTSAKVMLGIKEEVVRCIDNLTASDLDEKITDLSDECDRFYWP